MLQNLTAQFTSSLYQFFNPRVALTSPLKTIKSHLYFEQQTEQWRSFITHNSQKLQNPFDTTSFNFIDADFRLPSPTLHNLNDVADILVYSNDFFQSYPFLSSLIFVGATSLSIGLTAYRFGNFMNQMIDRKNFKECKSALEDLIKGREYDGQKIRTYLHLTSVSKSEETIKTIFKKNGVLSKDFRAPKKFLDHLPLFLQLYNSKRIYNWQRLVGSFIKSDTPIEVKKIAIDSIIHHHKIEFEKYDLLMGTLTYLLPNAHNNPENRILIKQIIDFLLQEKSYYYFERFRSINKELQKNLYKFRGEAQTFPIIFNIYYVQLRKHFFHNLKEEEIMTTKQSFAELRRVLNTVFGQDTSQLSNSELYNLVIDSLPENERSTAISPADESALIH